MTSVETWLDPNERQQLVECESVIEAGLASFVEVGVALAEVRDSKLYRQTHSTFEDYCRERWGLKRQRAYELIEASDVTRSLSEISDTMPSRESHAAELAPLRNEPERMAEAWKQANDTAEEEGRKVTAADVRKAVRTEPEPDRWEQAVSAHPFLEGLAQRHQAEAIDGARQLAGFTGNEHAHRLEMFRRCAAAAHKQGDNPPEWQRSMQLADLATHVCNLAAQLANKAAELVRAGDEWEPELEHLALLPDVLTAASQAASEVLALVGPATQIRRVK